MSSSLRRTNSELYLDQIDPLISLEPENKRARREEAAAPQCTLANDVALSRFSDLSNLYESDLVSNETEKTLSLITPWPFPNDIVLNVFSYLHFRDLRALDATCRWNREFLFSEESYDVLGIYEMASDYFDSESTSESDENDDWQEYWISDIPLENPLLPNSSLGKSNIKLSNVTLDKTSFQSLFYFPIRTLYINNCDYFSFSDEALLNNNYITDNSSYAFYLKKFTIADKNDINGTLLSAFIHKMPNLKVFNFRGNLQPGSATTLFNALQISPQLTNVTYHSYYPPLFYEPFSSSCEPNFPSLKKMIFEFSAPRNFLQFQNSIQSLKEGISYELALKIAKL